MSTKSSCKLSPLEPLGGLELIHINRADVGFCAFLFFLWLELCHRSISQSYGLSQELTFVSIICDCLRIILSTTTNVGLNIVKNMELGHDISIFHEVAISSNNSESFAFTALFAILFFSLRRFIGQGVIFLITPAFGYYVDLFMELLVAIVDEVMYPPNVRAGMSRHTQRNTPPPLPPSPYPIKGPTSREQCIKFQPTQVPSSRACLSPPKNKENAAIHQRKLGLNSARLGPLTALSRSNRLDDSPLNEEEMRIYIKVAGIKSAHTIQSQPKWRGLFRMNMPLYVAELQSQVGTPRSDSKNALVQDSPIHSSTTATVSLTTCSLTVTNHLIRLHRCLM